jgi:hypothetical protein
VTFVYIYQTGSSIISYQFLSQLIGKSSIYLNSKNMDVISKIWGIITLLLAVVCLIPFLGWGNWGVIVLAVVGIILSVFSTKKGGLYLNIIALVLAFFRLIIGGGIF